MVIILLTTPLWEHFSENTENIIPFVFLPYFVVNLFYYFCTILFCIKGAILVWLILLILGLFSHLINFLICLSSSNKPIFPIAYGIFVFIDLVIQLRAFLCERRLAKSLSNIENMIEYRSNVVRENENRVQPKPRPNVARENENRVEPKPRNSPKSTKV